MTSTDVAIVEEEEDEEEEEEEEERLFSLCDPNPLLINFILLLFTLYSSLHSLIFIRRSLDRHLRP